MTIVIEIVPSVELQDEANHTGLTEDGYNMVMDLLMEIGEVVTIRRG